MCQIDHRLRFCTCAEKPIIHNKKSRRHKHQIKPETDAFTWSLSAYMGICDFFMEGLLFMPSHQLGDILTDTFVLDKLEKENCFDFDYQPKEGDNLRIKDQRGNFLSFLYKNGHWKTGTYGFEEITEMVKNGTVELENL